ncbi:MAG: hypothetical protein D6739_04855, partial [Nitrospirae bacterium]
MSQDSGVSRAGPPPAVSERLRRHRLLRGHPMEPFRLKGADGLEDVVGALRLVHDSYVALGLMDPHPSGLRLLPHHLLPETRVFLAREGDEVVATLTLIPDSEVGLPLDAAYRREADALRLAGRRVAEISCLALAARYRRHDLLLHLFRLMHVYARHAGLDDLCVVVAPKHGRFYQHILLFEELGHYTELPHLNGAPARLYRQDLRTIEAATRDQYADSPAASDLYRFFFEEAEAVRPVALGGRGLTPEECR